MMGAKFVYVLGECKIRNCAYTLHHKTSLIYIVVLLMHATWPVSVDPWGSLKWNTCECWQHLHWEDYSKSCGGPVPGTIWKGLWIVFVTTAQRTCIRWLYGTNICWPETGRDANARGRGTRLGSSFPSARIPSPQGTFITRTTSWTQKMSNKRLSKYQYQLHSLLVVNTAKYLNDSSTLAHPIQ